jgi:inosine-uridine nucleoside N-ribohydrolase
VIESSNPTFIPLSVTVETALRRSHLAGLRKSGPLGALIARQAEAFAQDERIGERYAAACPGLPGDIINFQHDPLACAIALGWQDGVEFEEIRIAVEERDGWLVERPDPAGIPARVVTRIDGERFNQFWFDVVTRG